MDFTLGELLDELEAKKSNQYAQYLLNFREQLGRRFDLECVRILRNFPSSNILLSKSNTNKKLEKPVKDTPEAAVPEADLADVHLRYIPDFIREFRTKKDYWKKEFFYWNDIISQKNWKLYDKKVKEHVYRHKKILQKFDKLLQTLEPNLEHKNYFLQSLDPERVHNLVTAIREKSNEDNPFEDMMRSVEADNGKDLVQFSYILYAMYAMSPMDILH